MARRARRSPFPPTETPATLGEATQFDIRSSASNRDYRIFLSRPMGEPPAAGWPVVYLLDGNGAFPIAALIARMGQFTELEPALIVGVGYPVEAMTQWLARRNHDLAPRTPRERAYEVLAYDGPADDTHVGGADAFRQFLVDELRPLLAARIAIDPSRQHLVGYSLGGLFVLHALFTHPGDFSAYVAGSPSIWWNEGMLFDEEPKLRAALEAGAPAPDVMLSVGGLEQSSQDAGRPPGMDEAAFEALSQRFRMVENAREMAGRLAYLRERGGRLSFRLLPDETHLTAIPSSVVWALRFCLGADVQRKALAAGEATSQPTRREVS